MELSPSEIRYAQDSISDRFANQTPLTSTFARLLAGELSVDEFPRIKCFHKDGDWYATSGNRRLYLYKKLEELGELDTITVSKSHHYKHLTTKCYGLYIRFRGFGGVEEDMEKIISEWRRGKDIVSRWCEDRTSGNFTTYRNPNNTDESDYDDYY